MINKFKGTNFVHLLTMTHPFSHRLHLFPDVKGPLSHHPDERLLRNDELAFRPSNGHLRHDVVSVFRFTSTGLDGHRADHDSTEKMEGVKNEQKTLLWRIEMRELFSRKIFILKWKHLENRYFYTYWTYYKHKNISYKIVVIVLLFNYEMFQGLNFKLTKRYN